jgi:hypothetical protein
MINHQHLDVDGDPEGKVHNIQIYHNHPVIRENHNRDCDKRNNIKYRQSKYQEEE